MNKQQLIITKGLPGSGKSTWSKAWVNEDPRNRIRVNRDDIRRMLGPYWIPSREGLVTLTERGIISDALLDGYSVVVDATNFKVDWKHYFNIRSLQNIAELIYQDFTNISVDECILRDKLRPKEEQVGEEVIKNMAKKYLNYKDE